MAPHAPLAPSPQSTTSTASPAQRLCTLLGAALLLLALLSRDTAGPLAGGPRGAEGGPIALFAQVTGLRDGPSSSSSSSSSRGKTSPPSTQKPSSCKSLAVHATGADTFSFLPPTSFIPCEDMPSRSADRAEAAWRALESRMPETDPPDCPWPGPRGLFAMPVGGKNAAHIDKVVGAFASGPYDVILFAFDSTAWEELYPSWARAPNVAIKREAGGKWTFAKRFLTPELVDGYSHVFFWDDDIVPVEGYFNPRLVLSLLQATPEIGVSQPFVVGGGCHIGCRANYAAAHALPLQVEIMVPIYTRDMWRCLYDYMDDLYPRGFGLEMSLVCACNATFREASARSLLLGYFRVTHLDTKGLSKEYTFSEDWARNGWKILEDRIRSEVPDGDECIRTRATVSRNEFSGVDMSPSRMMCFVPLKDGGGGG